jgi:hypothetical protein
LVTLSLVGCPGSLDPSAFNQGTAGSTGQGMAGSTGMAGSASGGAGSPYPPGCDPVKLLTMTYNCSVASVCHDANGAAAQLNMLPANWPTLVNKLPTAGKTATTVSASICAGDPAFMNVPYIMKGSANGDGLIMRKLTLTGTVCAPGGTQMPTIPGPIDVTKEPGKSDMACIQAWATKLANM